MKTYELHDVGSSEQFEAETPDEAITLTRKIIETAVRQIEADIGQPVHAIIPGYSGTHCLGQAMVWRQGHADHGLSAGTPTYIRRTLHIAMYKSTHATQSVKKIWFRPLNSSQSHLGYCSAMWYSLDLVHNVLIRAAALAECSD